MGDFCFICCKSVLKTVYSNKWLEFFKFKLNFKTHASKSILRLDQKSFEILVPQLDFEKKEHKNALKCWAKNDFLHFLNPLISKRDCLNLTMNSTYEASQKIWLFSLNSSNRDGVYVVWSWDLEKTCNS